MREAGRRSRTREGKLVQGDNFGTAFQVDGTWYLRHLGGQGVLLPIHCSPELKATLRHGQAYRVEGRLSADHRGHPTGFYLNAAEAIGDTR